MLAMAGTVDPAGEILEARGLDVTPATLERVRAHGDETGAKILQRILDDEIRHVGIGSRHFHELCDRRDESPRDTWQNLVKTHFSGGLKPPFNDSARLAGGLPLEFYAPIASLTSSPLPNTHETPGGSGSD